MSAACHRHWHRHWYRYRGPLLALAFASLASSCAREEVRPDVLLVTLDTTRADALACYGGPAGVSPVIDELASQGLRFAHAYAPTPLTLPSHASLLTGRYPFEHGVRNNNTYALPAGEVSLAEVLQEAGYETGAFVGAYVLAPQYGLAQGFARYDADFDESVQTATFAERSARVVARRAVEWIEAQEDSRPLFTWVHFYDPHYPYALEAGEEQRFAQLYHDEVARCDRALGEILAALERSGRRERTLVVLTSDHGEGLGEHGESTHGYFLYEGTQRVPLVLSHPRLAEGRLREDVASLMDVVPTVLAFLGLEAPRTSGRDLLAGAPAEPQSVVLETELPRVDFALTPLRGIVSERDKLIRAPRPELYDLRADPTELENLASEQSELVAQLGARLEERMGGEGARASFTPDAEATRLIMGLGYAGGGESEAPTTADWDPRELAGWISLRNAGLEHFFAGRSAQAIEAMQELVARCESSHAGQLYLGLALAQEGEFARALAHLRRAVELQPAASADAYWNMAVCLHQLEQESEIPALLERTIELDPEHRSARQKLAENALRARDAKTARKHLMVLRESAADSPEGRWAERMLQSIKRGN